MEQGKMSSMIQETHDAVLRIEGRLEAGDERMDRLEEGQEKHARVLWGNGKSPGLVDDVRTLSNAQKFWARIGWAAVGAIAPVMAAGAAGAAWWLVKHVP